MNTAIEPHLGPQAGTRPEREKKQKKRVKRGFEPRPGHVVQAFVFALDPGARTEQRLRSHCGAARAACNWALSHVLASWDQRGAEASYGIAEDDLTPWRPWSLPNLRQDAVHQLTTSLSREYGTVVVEDLNVAGMVTNRRLARRIADAGFGEIRRQLDYKTRWNGGQRSWRTGGSPVARPARDAGRRKPSCLCTSGCSTATNVPWSWTGTSTQHVTSPHWRRA